MNAKYTKVLNKEQQKAVFHTTGPAVILAGAGSGKTRVLTYKAMYLLESKTTTPNRILMLTFTNKAADEMKKRIIAEINPIFNPNQITARTFHSFCALLLRKYKPVSGHDRNFTIFDTKEQLSVAKTIIKNMGSTIRISPSGLLYAISRAKNLLQTPGDMLSGANDFFEEYTAQMYMQYQKKLKELNAFDFDDLLLETAQLLLQDSHLRQKLQAQYQFILIDEYQDTNHAQYVIAQQLAKKHRNITVVGDFSQSIYSWRGADFTNLEKFQKHFKDALVFHLEQNYRSTKPILQTATNIISYNTLHPILNLWTNKDKGEDVGVVRLENEEEEAVYVLGTVNKLIKKYGYSLDDIAVLYRTNAQSRIFEELCLRLGIPYKIFGGTRFYERKEIRDVVSFMRLVLNPKDELAKIRIEKMGKKRGKSIISAIKKIKKENEPTAIIQNILDNSIYLEQYKNSDPQDAARLENIRELVSVASSFTSLKSFLDNIALIETGYERDTNTTNRLHLMTIHASKGLEFTSVFVVGLEDGLLPHGRSVSNIHDIEEERRLLYVAVTRAKKHLFLTYTKKRTIYGRSQYNLPSQFLTEAGLVFDDDLYF